MTNLDHWKIVALGRARFSAKGIAKMVFGSRRRRHVSRVYRELKKGGISLRDERNGLSDEARRDMRTAVSPKRNDRPRVKAA